MRSRPRFGFEGFQVWQDARDLAVLCHGVSRVMDAMGLPDEARRLRRAGLRPAAQLGESSGCVSLRCFVRQLGLARDSFASLSRILASPMAVASEDLALAREMAAGLAGDLARAVERSGW